MRAIMYILIIFFIVSCGSKQRLHGTYAFQDEELAIKMNFINDSLCEVKQVFYCDKVPVDFQENSFICKYEISKVKAIGINDKFKRKKFKFKKLFVKNLNDNISDSLFLIPNYQELCMQPVIPNSEGGIIRKKLGIKDGVIFNMLSDTLILYKDKISFGYHTLSKVKQKNIFK